jgi:hypothetical protein
VVAAPFAGAAEWQADHEADARENGTSNSGDAIAGQVVGVTSDGDTQLDATNHTRDAHVESGDTVAGNRLDRRIWTGGFGEEFHDDVIDLLDRDDDDKEGEWSYVTSALSGDAIGGQVAGVATSAGGTTDAVIANTSDDVDLESGDAEAFDDAYAETGQAIGGQGVGIASAGDTSLDATNLSHDVGVQSGDAFAQFHDATALTGDGIAGELVGIATASTGTADVVLANTSDDLDVVTGDADATYSAYAETGDGIAGQVAGINAGGITSVDARNLSQDGRIRTGDAIGIDNGTAITGDGIGGQILGVMSSPGGRADFVGDNTSIGFDVLTGDAFAENIDLRFTGFAAFIVLLLGNL